MKQGIRIAGVGVVMLTSLAITNPVGASDSHTFFEVRIEDRCDPVSFNAFLGDGACTPVKTRGTVTIDELFAELNPVDFGPDSWRFSRTDFSIEQGGTIRVKNIGGEAHTFTKVSAPGAGCVPELNEPLGLTNVVANCGGPEGPGDFVDIQLAGESRDVTDLPLGEHTFMCIIHPWMLSTVEVTSSD